MGRNNMICDLTTGICGEADGVEMEMIDLTIPQKKVTLYYVTDPICSHCWALEPVLRKFEQQYGQYLQIHTVMGGLLENWDGFADVSNGISSLLMLLVIGEKLASIPGCRLMAHYG